MFEKTLRKLLTNAVKQQLKVTPDFFNKKPVKQIVDEMIIKLATEQARIAVAESGIWNKLTGE